ncbi:toxin C-terminal domain-containing protein [Erwinia rhapontici]|uniref:toxin C-terminal domain-containing protein n=1 Tax=Erwinia rhapontici TaxID=55212 RepID=UPI001BD187DE|nr:toxin C-terminal domain-containing protein [Erwinia rhapontici]
MAAPEVRQGKPAVSDGTHRRKWCPANNFATEKVVVENNSLGAIVRAGEKALETCVQNATCRGAMNQMGIAVGLSNQQTEEAMRVGATHDPAQIARLTPEQIEYLDEQIKSGHGMSREMFGTQTWGDRLILPIADKDPMGGKFVTPAHEDKTGSTLSTPDQRDQNGASNTGHTDIAPDLEGSTLVTPIPDAPTKEDQIYLSLKGKEAQKAANDLGYGQRIPPQKAPFNSHDQPVFSNGKNYITPDVDSHNVTNGWKMFDRKGDRIGTYDGELNKVKG